MTYLRRLHLKALDDTSIAAPGGERWYVDIDDPATKAMTDFGERNMVTVEGHFPVDMALEIMKHAGVRAAFVVGGPERRILGLVTAYDILGEKPLRQLRAMGCTRNTCSRDDVTVQDVMERTRDWQVATIEDVEAASVGAVLGALQDAGRTHLPVIERIAGEAFRVRGIFSCAKLLRLTEFSRQAAA